MARSRTQSRCVSDQVFEMGASSKSLIEGSKKVKFGCLRAWVRASPVLWLGNEASRRESANDTRKQREESAKNNELGVESSCKSRKMLQFDLLYQMKDFPCPGRHRIVAPS